MTCQFLDINGINVVVWEWISNLLIFVNFKPIMDKQSDVQ